MYLHIGNDIILKNKDILFILNYEDLKKNKSFIKFFENINKKDILDISSNKPKSVIITKEKEKIKAYISTISSNTLAKRSKIE